MEVGGDFYDLFYTRGDHYGAVLGDVCGKGVEAAQVTAMARYTVRADASEHPSPAELLQRLNTAMRTQDASRFLTAIYTTFRLSAAGLIGRLALAGHPPALIRRADGHVQQLGTPGTLLGIFDEVHLTDSRFRLDPGDLLLLYTDGACEARPSHASKVARPMFDEDNLSAALAESHGLDAAATVERLARVLKSHHDGWTSDDIALLTVRVPPRL